MTDYIEDVGISNVDVSLEDDEDPETALRDVKMRLDELYGTMEDLEQNHPQQELIQLEAQVLEQVVDELEERV